MIPEIQPSNSRLLSSPTRVATHGKQVASSSEESKALPKPWWAHNSFGTAGITNIAHASSPGGTTWRCCYGLAYWLLITEQYAIIPPLNIMALMTMLSLALRHIPGMTRHCEMASFTNTQSGVFPLPTSDTDSSPVLVTSVTGFQFPQTVHSNALYRMTSPVYC